MSIPVEKLVPKFRLWLEYEGKTVLGEGGARILEEIERCGSISKAAESLSLSYRFVWNYLNKIKERAGEPVVEAFRGGYRGGGGARLTELGKALLTQYRRFNSLIKIALETGG